MSNQDIVSAWVKSDLHNSPLSRNVTALNRVTAALPSLVQRLDARGGMTPSVVIAAWANDDIAGGLDTEATLYLRSTLPDLANSIASAAAAVSAAKAEETKAAADLAAAQNQH